MSGFPGWLFSLTALTQSFYTPVLPYFTLSSFVRRSTARSDHSYVLPSTFHVEKSVLNFIEIRPVEWESHQFTHFVQEARSVYMESLLK
jgi:hypothetical protein